GHDEEHGHVGAQFLKPEQLRSQDVAQNEREIVVAVRPVQALLYQEYIELVSAIQGKKELKEVAVGHDQPGCQHDFRHVLQVAHGDEVFQSIRLAQRDGDCKHHGETGINGSGDKV